jgi:hypothetical protein
MLKNDGEDQLHRLCKNDEVLHRAKGDRNTAHNKKASKANCICCILRRNWLLKHATERTIEGRIDGKTRKKT